MQPLIEITAAAENDWWLVGTTLIGAVVGALASGGVSWFLQRNGANAAKAQADADHLERDRALAFSASAKLSRILTGTGIIRRHIHECLDRANREGRLAQRRFTIITPMANQFETIRFTAEELAAVLRMENVDLMNTVLEIDSIYNGLGAAMVRYSEARLAFGSEFGAVMDGRMGVTEMDRDTYRKAGPLMVTLDDLAEYLISTADTDHRQAVNAVNLLSKVGREKFKVFPRYELRNPLEPLLPPPIADQAVPGPLGQAGAGYSPK